MDDDDDKDTSLAGVQGDDTSLAGVQGDDTSLAGVQGDDTSLAGVPIPTTTVMTVGSHQVPFPMCTLETLQKYCSTGSLLLTFC